MKTTSLKDTIRQMLADWDAATDAQRDLALFVAATRAAKAAR